MILNSERYFSAGCVQAIIVTLAILLLPDSAGAMDSGIDLLEALNLRINYTNYEGITLIQGSQPQRFAYRLQNGERKLVVPMPIYLRTVDVLRRTPDFTLTAILRQEQTNTGTIIAFSNGNTRYLELQSSGRRDEIRFHYSYTTIEGVSQVHMESFPYRLADNTWHKVALSVSGLEIQLLIDCHPLYRRVTHFIPDRDFSASNMQLFVGQRNLNSHSLFKGDIENVHIIPGPYGFVTQCPHMDTQCPTCGQFGQLQNSIEDLKLNLFELKQRLVAAENRVRVLEDCDCQKSCTVNGTRKADGENWDVDCDVCKCEHGIVKCGARICEQTTCKYPVKEDGQCCPKCLKNCYINKQDFEHGEQKTLGCRDCSCNDGNMKCEMLHCPKLSCPTELQLSVPDECCKFCPGDDYCSKGHACHTNATCLNLNTKYTCTCQPGFQGDGFNCTDINECAQEGGLNGNHCHLNTKCVNTFGGYVCECLSGYRRLDKFNCVEINECRTNAHRCHQELAECINTQGSYNCRCKNGYAGDGYTCNPVCNQTCLNGGHCVSPDVCSCRMGFTGTACEQDLDECAAGLHNCKTHSICINMPGWFFCQCKPGYENKGTDCMDIDECYSNTHSCHPSAVCINNDGHFECQCPVAMVTSTTDNNDDDNDDDDSIDGNNNNENTPLNNCRLSCMFEDLEIPDGTSIAPRNQPCKTCTCDKGVITCKDTPCNCSVWQGGEGRDLCCPQCDPKESCQHQELKHVVFRSGEQWIYQCQTCECLYGEFDCWKLECPPLVCSNPLPLQAGDCCPRCENDPCNYSDKNYGNQTIGQPCIYNKLHPFESRNTFDGVSSAQCASCECKDGQLHNLNSNCSDQSRSLRDATANN